MRSLPVVFIVALIVPSGSSAPVSAACRTRTVGKTSDELQVAVPFAVPIGVPVAPLAPYFYSYQQIREMSGDSGMAAATPQSPANTVAPISAVPTSVVASHCASCHGGQTPRAGLSLEKIKDLNCGDRLRAIRAVMTGKMPQGESLDPDQLRGVVLELANSGQQEAGLSPGRPAETRANP